MRWVDKQKKLLKSTKFPAEYNIKVDILPQRILPELQVDMKKIKLEVIKPWISKQITELLGFEDEVLIGYVLSMLEEKVTLCLLGCGNYRSKILTQE